jgi:RNA polymerase sigma factor (sigma-70 family)
MASLTHVLRHLRTLSEAQASRDLSDGELLERFRVHREETAFALLVQRHGPMVLGVCRRLLGDAHAAEDAFQATFLILVRKAASIRKRSSVASWLYGVARRVAVKARLKTARDHVLERQSFAMRHSDGSDQWTSNELRSVLDEELEQLPEKYRSPLVLCALQGKTHDQAARELGCPRRSLSSRLARAQELLRARFTRRGFTVSAVALTAMLGEKATAAVPALLTIATVRAAMLKPTEAISANVAALTEEGIKAMSASKAKAGLALVLLATALTAFGHQLVATDEQPAKDAKPPATKPVAEGPKSKLDLHGDPLPPGAIMRLGTLERRAVDAKLAMSADGKSIIGVRAGKYVHVWDAATGKLREKRELIASDAWRQFWLSDDGRWLANADHDSLTVWDLQSGKKAHQLTIKGSGYIMPARFSADGKMIAAVSRQTRHFVHAWKLADGKEVFTKEIRDTAASSGVLAFSPDGKRLLASFTSDKEGMHCWDIATGNELWQEKEFGPQSMIFTPDGNILSTQDRYHVVDIATGKPLPLGKVPPLTWDMRPKLTPDGRMLLISTNDEVIVWDMVNGKEIRTLKGDRRKVRRLTQFGGDFLVAPDGKSIVTKNGELQCWNLATGQPLWADNYDAGHVEEVTSLVLSGDGKQLASASADGSVRLWDMTTGKALHVWPGHEWRRTWLDFRSEKAGVTALDMTPDGRWIASAGSEGKIHIHDAATGKLVHAIALPERERGEDELRVFHLRITPDGTKAVAQFGAEGFYHDVGEAGPLAEHTYRLATWELKTGALVERRAVKIQPARSSAISPDGRTFLAGGVLTDVKTGKEIAKLEGLVQASISHEPFAFSPDGTFVVGVFAEVTKKNGTSYHSFGGIRIWEAATGKTVAQLKPKTWVGQVAIHPNNRYVITNDYDGVKIWDAITGKAVAARQMHEKVHSSTTSGSYAGCLTFTPDGRLVTGHPDSTVLLWNMPLPPATPQPLPAKELETLWSDLADADAAKAWRVIWRMSDASAVPLLRERLKPVLPAPAEKVNALVADLDNEAFDRRQEAVKQLKALGWRAGPTLRQALEANPTPETKRRIQAVLTALETPLQFSAEEIRELRAVLALERTGSRESRETLAALAKGIPQARLTRDAKAALQRLERR